LLHPSRASRPRFAPVAPSGRSFDRSLGKGRGGVLSRYLEKQRYAWEFAVHRRHRPLRISPPLMRSAPRASRHWYLQIHLDEEAASALQASSRAVEEKKCPTPDSAPASIPLRGCAPRLSQADDRGPQTQGQKRPPCVALPLVACSLPRGAFAPPQKAVFGCFYR
jgi:hypothetical protein